VTTGRDDIASIVRAMKPVRLTSCRNRSTGSSLSHRLRYILRASRAFAELSRDLERLSAAEEEAEATNGSKSGPVAKGDEPRTPPNAMIGVSGMISDRTFDPLSEKTALSSDWVELDTIVARIGRLQLERRSVEKGHGNIARLNALAEAIDAGLIERDRLISRIGNGIGA